jgi:hypothetical protein
MVVLKGCEGRIGVEGLDVSRREGKANVAITRGVGSLAKDQDANRRNEGSNAGGAGQVGKVIGVQDEGGAPDMGGGGSAEIRVSGYPDEQCEMPAGSSGA